MVTLYWMSISHPSQAARTMLDMKGVEYTVVNVSRPIPGCGLASRTLSAGVSVSFNRFRGGSLASAARTRSRCGAGD